MDSDFYQTINANVMVADHDFSDFDEKVTEAMQIWAANHPHPHVPVVAFAFDFGQGGQNVLTARIGICDEKSDRGWIISLEDIASLRS